THALREVLVRRPDADLVDARIRYGEMCGGGERVVRLELDHWPDGDAHGYERLLERMKLREQRRLHVRARLIARPEIVAERFDDVIGGDAEVRRALLDHLQHGVQHPGHRAERRVLLPEPAQAVEMAEELVGPVDEMYDHVLNGDCHHLSEADRRVALDLLDERHFP